jgi:hypothetical protein
MHRTPLSIPEIALIGGTRAALGAGLGLLLADRLSRDQRQAIGWTLFAVGAVTSVPILIQVLKSDSSPVEDSPRRASRADLEYARH